MTELVLGVDGGGSKTQTWLADSTGAILGRGTGGASNYQSIGKEIAERSLLDSIHAAYKSAHIPFDRVASICLGISGVGRQEDRDWVQDFASRHRLAEKIVVINDALLLLWAGTPQGWGLGLISGTGSIAFGRTADGREARTGGWGWLAGDEGSGYEIGIRVLRAATQAADGRRPLTGLLPGLLDHWRLQDPMEIVPRIYRPPIGREEIARLAALVASEALKGDETALEIETQAGRDLAAMLVAASHRLELQNPVPCALGGGVLVHNKRLVELVIKNTHSSGLELIPCQTVAEPVGGAVRCALHQLK